MAKDGNYAIVLSYDEGEAENNHSFSVVGADGDYILVQESNLSEAYKDRFELIPDSFPPTYKVSETDFKKNFYGYSTLKLK